MKTKAKAKEDEIRSVIALMSDGTFREFHGEPLRTRKYSWLTGKYDATGKDKAADLFRVCMYHRSHYRMMDDDAYGIVNDVVQEYRDLVEIRKIASRLVSADVSDKTKSSLEKKLKDLLEKIPKA